MLNDIEFTVLEDKRIPNVYAINSTCYDGKHVIFWDFDIKKSAPSIKKIENALTNIQKNFSLSTIFILETRTGYNAICLDKLDKIRVANIKYMTPFDDRKHLEHGALNGWKLRIGKDKKIISMVNAYKNKKYKCSNAHRIALKTFFDIEVIKESKFDDSKGLQLYSYWDWKTETNNSMKKIDIMKGIDTKFKLADLNEKVKNGK